MDYPTGTPSVSMCAVLAVDTSTEYCSVAFVAGEESIERHIAIPRAHNRHVLNMVQEVMGQRPLSSVDRFACGIGPGSFTGLRIATSVIQGFAWSHSRPAVGVCSLQAQAWSYADAEGEQAEGLLLSTIDAQIGQLYWRWFYRGAEGCQPLGPAQISYPDKVLLPPNLRSDDLVKVLGTGCEYQAVLSGSLGDSITWVPDARPRAREIAHYGSSLLEGSSDLRAPATLLPQYVQQDIGWKKIAEQGKHG